MNGGDPTINGYRNLVGAIFRMAQRDGDMGFFADGGTVNRLEAMGLDPSAFRRELSCLDSQGSSRDADRILALHEWGLDREGIILEMGWKVSTSSLGRIAQVLGKDSPRCW